MSNLRVYALLTAMFFAVTAGAGLWQFPQAVTGLRLLAGI